MSQSQIQNESRHALDSRINLDELAYNKIFVGGLHYDTRDGKSCLLLIIFYFSFFIFYSPFFILHSSHSLPVFFFFIFMFLQSIVSSFCDLPLHSLIYLFIYLFI